MKAENNTCGVEGIAFLSFFLFFLFVEVWAPFNFFFTFQQIVVKNVLCLSEVQIFIESNCLID